MGVCTEPPYNHIRCNLERNDDCTCMCHYWDRQHARWRAALERIHEITRMGIEGNDDLENRDEIERIARRALTPAPPWKTDDSSRVPLLSPGG